MARRRRGGGDSVRVSITGGLERMAKVPGWLEEGQRKQLDLAGTRLRDSLRRAAPGGGASSIARQTRSVTLSLRRVLLSNDHPGAKALDKGAFIRSKRGPGTAIRLEGAANRFVAYPRGVRLPKREWWKKGLRPRRKIVQQTFDEVFGDLERSVA